MGELRVESLLNFLETSSYAEMKVVSLGFSRTSSRTD